MNRNRTTLHPKPNRLALLVRVAALGLTLTATGVIAAPVYRHPRPIPGFGAYQPRQAVEFANRVHPGSGAEPAQRRFQWRDRTDPGLGIVAQGHRHPVSG